MYYAIHLFSFLDHFVKAKLFNVNCTSFYGIPLLNLSSKQFEQLCVAWRVSIKYLLQLNIRTRSQLLPHLINSINSEKVIHSRFMSFLLSGLRHPNEFISTIFRHSMFLNYSYFKRNLNFVFYTYDLNWNAISNMTINSVKKHIKLYNFEVDFRVNIIKELMMIRDNQLYVDLEPHEVNFMLNALCTA